MSKTDKTERLLEELADRPTCSHDDCEAHVSGLGLVGTEHRPLRRRVVDKSGSEELIEVDDRDPVCVSHFEEYHEDED